MNFLKLAAYVLIPTYRRKIKREAGWKLVTGAASHLILKQTCDRGDIDAGRILTAKMKELVA